MQDHEIQFRQMSKNGAAVGVVYISGVGKMVTRIRPHPNKETCTIKEADLERLATIVSIDKMLRYTEAPSVSRFVPPSVKVALALVHRLVKMRRAALLSGKPTDSKDFEEFLNKALNSPIRAVRAIAAGTIELLK